tara:strand:- start:22129 stop:22332 length:204 start_codon:yes stop_codon:yes gene_type:complete
MNGKNYLKNTKMSKRKNQIQQELAILKIDLNSNYGVGRYEEERCQKIFDRMLKLKEELKFINQNKDE